MTTFSEFFTQDISRSDVIAIGALLVSLLTAIYTRRQWIESRRGRESAVREARRPERIELFRAMKAFCDYCTKYYSLYLVNETNGTRDLVATIEEFNFFLGQQGSMQMPEVEAEAKELLSMAWNMKRHLDRLAAQTSSLGLAKAATEAVNSIEELVDAFAKKQDRLREIFAL